MGYLRVLGGLVDDTGHDERDHEEATLSNGVLHGNFAQAVVLRQHVVSEEPAALAHIQLVRAADRFRELLFRQP